MESLVSLTDQCMLHSEVVQCVQHATGVPVHESAGMRHTAHMCGALCYIMSARAFYTYTSQGSLGITFQLVLNITTVLLKFRVLLQARDGWWS